MDTPHVPHKRLSTRGGGICNIKGEVCLVRIRVKHFLDLRPAA